MKGDVGGKEKGRGGKKEGKRKSGRCRDVGGGRQQRKKNKHKEGGEREKVGREVMEGRRKQWAKLHNYKDYSHT